MTRKIAGLLVAVFLVSASPVFAEPGIREGDGPPKQEGPRAGRGEFREKLKKELQLSSEQEEKLNVLREARKSGLQSRRQMFEQRKALMELIKKPGTSESEALQAVEKLNQLQSEANTQRVKNMLEMKKILSPEQFELMRSRVREKLEERRGPGQERLGRGMGKPGPGPGQERGPSGPPSPEGVESDELF